MNQGKIFEKIEFHVVDNKIDLKENRKAGHSETRVFSEKIILDIVKLT
jgi:uncharacterized surface protein with fasciclin (FAS1) repeats